VFCAIFSLLSLLRRWDVERRLLAAVTVRQEHNTANVRIVTAMLPALGNFLVKSMLLLDLIFSFIMRMRSLLKDLILTSMNFIDVDYYNKWCNTAVLRRRSMSTLLLEIIVSAVLLFA
jgi:hypothetical protein